MTNFRYVVEQHHTIDEKGWSKVRIVHRYYEKSEAQFVQEAIKAAHERLQARRWPVSIPWLGKPIVPGVIAGIPTGVQPRSLHLPSQPVLVFPA